MIEDNRVTQRLPNSFTASNSIPVGILFPEHRTSLSGDTCLAVSLLILYFLPRMWELYPSCQALLSRPYSTQGTVLNCYDTISNLILITFFFQSEGDSIRLKLRVLCLLG
jgi:hypothetical protein